MEQSFIMCDDDEEANQITSLTFDERFSSNLSGRVRHFK